MCVAAAAEEDVDDVDVDVCSEVILVLVRVRVAVAVWPPVDDAVDVAWASTPIAKRQTTLASKRGRSIIVMDAAG